MARSNASCESEQFSCYRLCGATADDERDIMAFEAVDSKGSGLTAYLQLRAFPDEDAGEMRTYLVRDRFTGELAGFFSLKAGMVTRDEEVEDGRAKFDTSPAVELANFAVNNAYLRAHPLMKGCGRNIFRELVLDIIERTADLVGVSAVYLYALPYGKVIASYERYGFSRLAPKNEEQLHARIKPRYDAQYVFMVMKLR